MKNLKILSGCICLFLSFSLSPASDYLAQADSLFELRDVNFDAERLIADTTFINRAIALYESVLLHDVDSLKKTEALWKLLQVFYFKGQFGTEDKKLKQTIYNQGLNIGEKYIDQVPESVAIYSWLGIMWARWAEVYGTFAAARKGVAGKVKYYGEKTIQLDDHYLDAGGYRLLGMLHFSVPKIPLLLTWPSKDLALDYLEKAYRIAPHNLYNKIYLAEVLYSNKQHERAESLLNDILNAREIVHDLAIDSLLKQQARELRAKHD